MRIGEIAIIGPDLECKKHFMHSVCDEIILQNDELIVGRLGINEQLMIHLYGLDADTERLSPSWDLVARRLLGYVLLFDWKAAETSARIASTIDWLSEKSDRPLVVAANLGNGQQPVPNELIDAGLNLSERIQFTFCTLSEPESARQVLVKLIDCVLEQLN